ncbi:MAG TPA: hypothetical protein VLX28_17015 [Thermoanaerobaculia bacterium]|nr:hypothetical protein [Thermoanaerobaculia bacterium]
MNRRELLKSVLGTLASYSLLETLFTRDAFASPVKPITDHWVRKLNDMCRDLETGRISPTMWQAKVKELYDRVELPDLLAAIDFARLSADFDYPDLGVSTRPVEFPRLAGIPQDIVFVHKIFGMKKDRAIIPHGHRNMTSCHYVLKGEFQLKQYDKVEEDDTHMVIEPTIHEIARVGSHSSISDEKNNVHWLRATTETAFTFDAIVLDLKGLKTDIDNIDPDGAEKIAGGRLRVRKLSVGEALRKYGHDTHH